MNISGESVIDASVDKLWQMLLDPYVLERVVPGCEQFDRVTEHEFRVAVELQVGKIYDRFRGLLLLRNLEPPWRFELLMDGEGPAGMISGRGWVALENHDTGMTLVTYHIDVEAGGRIGQVQPRLLQTTARAFARRTLENLERQVALDDRAYERVVPPAFDVPESAPAALLARLRTVAVATALAGGGVVALSSLGRWRKDRLARDVAAILAKTTADDSQIDSN